MSRTRIRWTTSCARRRARDGSIDGDDYARVSPASLGLNRGPRIAVIYAAGTINGGKSGYDPVNGAIAGSDTLIEYIRQARRDTLGARDRAAHRQPGRIGDGVGRDLARADDRAATSAPIGRSIASMSDLAASGGYYIAMPAQVIVAQPSTLTGSIGIFGGKFVTGGVYEKLGAHIESTSIGQHAEINSPARPYNAGGAEEAAGAAAGVLRPVRREGRRRRGTRTPEKIDALAQGRVWTGRQAKQNGLVDELGGLDRADRDREAAREDCRRQRRRAGRLSAAQELLRAAVGAVRAGRASQVAVGAWLTANLTNGELEALRALRGPLAMFRRGEPLALMPFTFLR